MDGIERAIEAAGQAGSGAPAPRRSRERRGV